MVFIINKKMHPLLCDITTTKPAKKKPTCEIAESRPICLTRTLIKAKIFHCREFARLLLEFDSVSGD